MIDSGACRTDERCERAASRIPRRTYRRVARAAAGASLLISSGMRARVPRASVDSDRCGIAAHLVDMVKFLCF